MLMVDPVAAQKQRTPVITIKWLKDPSFVGREDTLHEIERILIKDGRLALTGQGGVGYVCSKMSY